MRKVLILSLALFGCQNTGSEKTSECVQSCKDRFERGVDSCAEASGDNADCSGDFETLNNCKKSCNETQK